MRPSSLSNWMGSSHVLADVVAPHVADAYAASILDGLLASLGALAAGWRQVPQYLRWDAEQTAVVLTAAAPGLDAGTDRRTSTWPWTDAPDDELDVARLESHHRRLRGLLERAVPAIVEQPARPRPAGRPPALPDRTVPGLVSSPRPHLAAWRPQC